MRSTRFLPEPRPALLGLFMLWASLAPLQEARAQAAGPSLDLVKVLTDNTDPDASGNVSDGDVLTYTATATNIGGVTLNNVVVNDPLTSPNTITCPTLAVGASCVLTGTYSVTGADAAAGQIDNTATASSDETGSINSSISTPVAFIPAPAMSLSKALTGNADDDGSGNVTAGDTLTYTVTGSNTGNTTLTNWQIEDPQLSPSVTICSGVSPGGTCQLVGTHVVTPGEGGAGNVSNTATALSAELPTPISSNTVDTPVTNAPGLSVAKSVANDDNDGSGSVTQGDVLTYTVRATNTGNSALSAVTVDDALIAPNSASCATLALGAHCDLVGTYTVSALDAANGQVSNTGNADSAETSPVSASLTTAVASAPAMSLFKTVANADNDGSGDVTEGDLLTYTVSAKNIGDIALTSVNVADAMIGPNSTNCATLAVGASCDLVGTYTVSAADAIAGQLTNSATATAKQIVGSKNVSLTTPVNGALGLAVSKSVANADNDGSGSVTEGDVLTYTVSAKNSGNVTLTNVQVGDPLILPASASCTSLAAGASCDLVGSYTVTAADALAGAIDNTGTANANELGAPQTASLSTPVAGSPAMTLAKSMANADNDGSGSVTLGDVLTYSVSATNTGNVDLANVVVSDPMITPSSTSCASLAPNATCDLVGSYTVAASDVGAGVIDNTGSATANGLAVPVTASHSTAVAGTPAISVAKSVVNADNDGSGDVTLGDVLTYTVRATNSGSTPLTGVNVSDALITPNAASCATLAMGANCDLVGTYTVDAGNVSAGLVSNVGSATANEISGAVTAVLATPVKGMPQLDLVKVVSDNNDADASGNVSQGDLLTYTATATNIGGAVLTNVVVSDPLISPNTTTCASVAIGASCALTGTYTVTGADSNAGQIDNTATATSDQTSTVSFAISTPVNFLPAPAMTLAKALGGNADEDGNGVVTQGDTLTYTITASNTGNTTLTNLQIDDAQLTPAVTVCSGISPGGACQLVGTHVVTQGEAAAGKVSNTATAFSAELVSPMPSNTVDTPVVSGTAMTLVKTLLGYTDNDGSGNVSEGDQLDYDVRATNTGATTLTNVVVSDDLLADSQPCATLAPGQQCFVGGAYTVTGADALAGQVVNTGTATATEVPGPLTQAVVTPVSAPPTLSIVSGDGTAGYGGQTATLVVRLRDIASNPIANATIDWTGANNASSITDGNGEASNTVSFNGVQGSITVVATYTPGNVQAVFTLESISAALAAVAGNNQSAPVGSVLQPLVVLATDNGAPAGAPIRWTVLAGDATLTPTDTGTDDNGEATTTVTFGSTPGEVQVQAQRTDAGETAVFTLTATVAAASTLSIVAGDAQAGLTSTLADAPLVVRLVDGLGAPIADAAIDWLASGAGSVSPTSTSTNANGESQVQLHFGATAGAVTVTASAASAGSPSVSFSASAVNGVLGVASGDGQSGPVDTTLPLPLKVVVLDPSAARASAKGPSANALDGVPVSFTVTSGGGSVQAVVMTDANGEAATPFQLGPTPGTQTVRASIAGGSSVDFSATATLQRTLVLVSGNGQAAAPGAALPAPLVVQAQDNGVDVAGAAIVWSVVSGSATVTPLGATDAAGLAQATLVLGAAPGAVTVRAERAQDPSVFVLFSASLAQLQSLPGLSKEQRELAVAIDETCATLAGQASRSAQQQDFLDRCQDLVAASTLDAAAATQALDRLVPGLALAMQEAAFNAAQAQFQNLKVRIAALRSGTQGASFDGLALSNGTGTISLGGLARALTADEDEPAGSNEVDGEFQRWGFFASGTIGRGEADPGNVRPAYDYDINGLTAGADYRFSDRFILGGALGYTRQDADLRDAPGRMDMHGYSLSAYATWFRKDSWYTDAVLTWGRDSFALVRTLDYTLPTPGGGHTSVAQTARTDSDGDLLDAALTFGRDFQRGGWSIGPYGRLLYTRLDFERMVEAMSPGTGNGLALEIDERSLVSVASQLGAKFTYAHSTEWGVLTPHLQLEWEHEYRDDPKALVARFLADPEQTPFVLGGEDIDTDYFRMSLGLSIIMTRGRSGFLLYERTVGRDGFFQDNFGLGLRIEF